MLTVNGHKNSVNSVAFSPDRTKIVSGSDDQTVRVWDAESGSIIPSPLLGHTSSVNSVAFSPDGTKIVSGSDDQTVHVWDAESGSIILGPLLGHTSYVNSVTFSPDGMKIVSSSDDSTLHVWDADSGLAAHGPYLNPIRDIASVAFTPDMKIALQLPDDTFYILNLQSGSYIPVPSLDNTVLSLSLILSNVGWINTLGSRCVLWILSHLRCRDSLVASFTGARGVQLLWFNERFLPMIVTGLDFAWWSHCGQ